MTTERFGQTSTRTARTQKRCNWCDEAILPGEIYHRYWGPQVDGVGAYLSHPECEDAQQRELDSVDGHADYVSWGEYHRRGMTMLETEDAP